MRNALILGGGEVGLALAADLSGEVQSLGVHCRRASSAEAAQRRLSRRGARTEGRFSWGDLFIPNTPLVVGGKIIDAAMTERDCRERLMSRPAAGHRHRLGEVAAGWDTVIDCTNAATSLADPVVYRSLRQVCGCGGAPNCPACEGLALRALRHYVVSLDTLLRKRQVARYVKVSTTGLGAMGLDVPFTHGDVAQEVLSPALWEKVDLAGALHNHLWALRRTFPGRVSLVIPAACVGFPSEPTWIPLPGDATSGVPGGERPREAPAIWLGEGRLYSRDEMLVLSSPWLMGSITAEEVSESVRELLRGDTASDLLNAMSDAALWRTDRGAKARAETSRMLAQGGPADAVAFGALGPVIAVLLIELHAVRAAMTGQAIGRSREMEALAMSAAAVAALRADAHRAERDAAAEPQLVAR
ncbi:MAG: hypothetical protein ACLQDY_05195 [Streptosporangiaceae bacterium]